MSFTLQQQLRCKTHRCSLLGEFDKKISMSIKFNSMILLFVINQSLLRLKYVWINSMLLMQCSSSFEIEEFEGNFLLAVNYFDSNDIFLKIRSRGEGEEE